MKDKEFLVIGVTSGIAIYKTLDVISKLRNEYNIHVVMTENAMKMVSPITFATLSRNKVQYDTFSEKDWISHISLADNADIFAVIPATANCIGKIAHGIGDDLLTTVAIAVNCRKIIAPAMNVNMWNNPIVQNNLEILKNNNWEVIDPDIGMLACGYEGKGKLASVDTIINYIRNNINEKLDKNRKELDENLILKGKKVVVTAGASIEDIDPVRYITNRSSGKMGIRFAEAARDLGADVVLIHGHISEKQPEGIKNIGVRSALETLKEMEKELKNADVLIMAAAIADYRIDKKSDEKIKKTDDDLTLKLTRNPDILKTVKETKGKRIHVGFALESQNLLDNAKKKLKEKGVDLLVANTTKAEISPFGGDETKVFLLHKNGEIDEFPILSKKEIANKVLMQVGNLIK